MTNEEIKNALKVCVHSSCEGCPYEDNYSNCTDRVKDDARYLIIEQESEIERLKVEYSKLQEQFAQYQMASDKEIVAQVKQAKIDVLTELKKKAYVNNYCREVVEVEKIDEMIKELTK